MPCRILSAGLLVMLYTPVCHTSTPLLAIQFLRFRVIFVWFSGCSIRVHQCGTTQFWVCGEMYRSLVPVHTRIRSQQQRRRNGRGEAHAVHGNSGGAHRTLLVVILICLSSTSYCSGSRVVDVCQHAYQTYACVWALENTGGTALGGRSMTQARARAHVCRVHI